MRKVALLAHISLDGYVSGENGEFDGFEAGEENLRFVCKLTRDADAALFGRKSYQLLDQYWPIAKDRAGASEGEIEYSNWYNNATKVVISKTLTKGNSTNTTILGQNFPDEIEKLKQQPGKDILIFGSPSIAQLLIQHNLIDTYWIFINPVLFGKGISLFPRMDSMKKFKHISMTEFPNGEIAHRFDKTV